MESTTYAHLTIPAIARKLGATDRQVDYAIRRAGIPETVRVGIIRLYDPAAVHLIRAALADTSRRGRVARAH